MLQFPLIERAADLDLTPLLTTCEYAGPVTSYMPIATARFAFSPDEGAVFLLSSFDTHPSASVSGDVGEDHLVCAAFNFFPEENGTVLRVLVNAEGRCLLYRGRELLKETRVPVLRGEEERGIYWGARVTLDRGLLTETYGRDLPVPGQTLTGNVFKRKSSPPGRHFGAIAPLAPGKDIFDDENLHPFEAVRM